MSIYYFYTGKKAITSESKFICWRTIIQKVIDPESQSTLFSAPHSPKKIFSGPHELHLCHHYVIRLLEFTLQSVGEKTGTRRLLSNVWTHLCLWSLPERHQNISFLSLFQCSTSLVKILWKHTYLTRSYRVETSLWDFLPHPGKISCLSLMKNEQSY